MIAWELLVKLYSIFVKPYTRGCHFKRSALKLAADVRLLMSCNNYSPGANANVN